MADHAEESKGESLIEKIEDKFHSHDSSSSSSDSDNEKPKKSEKKSEEAESSSIKDKIWRLFGREKPVHKVLGGGKPADVFLWRNKKISASVLGGATAIWVLFELLEYHLLSLVCHCLILSLAVLFLWSNATTFINKSPPHIPEVSIPEDLTVNIALSLRYEINRGLAVLRSIASGKDLKKFIIVITVPVLYEKYEDKVDSFGEKAAAEFKKHYAVVHAKYLSKIPRAPLKDKKLH
ncbi:uncharacterized protein A4U43_C01F3980 [Asparagus officinalis]|uniref:Reticulon-like protein n=1 Tax=Asparagus officinalis TaxID=4686 RepID=A0A5P1FM92_ASPOF|nr:uncharacterized protein A4U43_C01F3980 [Asparagus officinalis]